MMIDEVLKHTEYLAYLILLFLSFILKQESNWRTIFFILVVAHDLKNQFMSGLTVGLHIYNTVWCHNRKKISSALKARSQFTQHPVLLPVPAEKHHVISI